MKSRQNFLLLQKTPETMAKESPETIASIIRPCGLSPAKSKAIQRLSEILTEKYDGQVPKTMEELESLPGVGHKNSLRCHDPSF